MSGDTVFDPGLQPERTLLAWRRTCLAFGVASVVIMRFTVEVAGILAVVVAIVGIGLAVAAYLTASVGYRRAHVSLNDTGRLSHGAWPMALATLAALLFGGACAGYVLLAR